MAGRKPSGATEGQVPRDFANVPAPGMPMLDHSFTLQAVMELQKAVAEIGTKTDRLIEDLAKQNNKLDEVLGQVSFVKGALYVTGVLLGFAVVAAGWLLSGKILVSLKP